MQAASGINDQDIDVAGQRGRSSVEGDGGGVAALLAFDDFDVEAMGPGFKLSDCAGSEGVARAEKNSLAFFAERGTEFGDAGGFAGPVDACDENHTGFFTLRRELEGAVLRGPESGDFFLEVVKSLVAVFHLAAAEVGAETFNELGGGLDPDVCLKEAAFDFIDERFVEAAARENVAKAQRTGDDGFAGLSQTLLELIDDGTEETQGSVLEKAGAKVRECDCAIASVILSSPIRSATVIATLCRAVH